MKNTFTCILTLFVLSILFHQNSFALKPVAKSVKEMHDLNVTFRPVNIFADSHQFGAEKFTGVLTSGTSVEMIPGKLFSAVQQNSQAITLNIPFGGTVIAVELVRVNIFTDDFILKTGNDEIVNYTPGIYYRGIISGDPNSIAAFSFFNDELYGVVSDATHGNINVARLRTPVNVTGYVIYSDKDLLKSPGDYCKTLDNPSIAPKISSLPPTTSATTKCVRLYYEVDNDIYQNNGSVVNATNWMTAVHNNVATIYANDNIDVGLSSVYVWSTPDPYTGADSNEQLDLFRQVRPSFNGDAGQLVCHDFNYGGLGYLDALCSSIHYCYGDVDYTYSAVPTYSWTVEVVTHEFGHNLGSPHTHNCNWPIGALDDCYTTEGGCPPGPTPVNGGTIMSYCHLSGAGINFSNGFSQYPAAAITNSVNSASCLGASCTVCPVPSNNACNTPVVLPSSSNCVYTPGNLCGTTESVAPITCNGATAASANDLWYRVSPTTSDLIITCKSGTNTNAVMALYSGSCALLNLMDCSDATALGGTETITATVTAGLPYYIRVYDFDGNTTGRDFAICASHSCIAATNNSCTSPVSLNIGSACTYVSGDLCSATESQAPANCSGFQSNDAFDLWYSITPTQSNVKISAQSGPDADLIAGIYSGTCGALNLINCVDSTSSGGIEIINATLTPGNTYYIRVYDWNSNLYGTDFQICAQYTSCVAPTAPTSANATSTTICSGTSTSLSVTGTLSSGATWHWYSSSCGGTAVGTGASLNVSPSITTTYYVRAEDGSCFSTCRSVTITVTQTPVAATSISSTVSSICNGESVSLTANGSSSAGATWHWYSGTCGGTNAGTGSSITVSPSATTTYFLRAENGNCFSACVNKSITVNAIPAIPQSLSSNANVICLGETASLSVTGILATGSDWYWYTDSCGGVAAGQGATIPVSPSTDETYYVRAENSQCNSACLTIFIGVVALPASPAISFSNDTFSVNHFSSYQWYMSSDSITFNAVGNNQLQPVVGEGWYFVVVADSNGCSVNSDTLEFADPTGIDHVISPDVASVYPNPFTSELTVDLRNSPAQAVIYDHTGKLVYKGFLIPGPNTIGMNGFSAGIYRIELVMGDRIFGQSLIKQ